MHTTLSSKWAFLALFLATTLLAGCGVTTKKTFLDEPVQETVGNAVPISSATSETNSSGKLSQNPALNTGEKTRVQKLLNVFTPYRINIQQGNFISHEMLNRVQQGMTKEQVRFALGTPLLTDVFHAGRWDYIFRLQKPNGEITNNRVIVYFEDNRVARIVNDPLPNETQYLDTVAGPAKKQKVAETDKEENEKNTINEIEKDTDLPSEEATVAAIPVLQSQTTETSPSDTAESVDDTLHSAETTESYATPSPEPTEESEVVVPVVSSPVSAQPSYAQPAITETPDTDSDSSHTETDISKEKEEFHDSVQENQYESEPITTDTKEDVYTSTPEVDAEPVYTPQPIQSEAPQKATTIQDVSEELEEENYRAAPNSTMQLHELMQPQ